MSKYNRTNHLPYSPGSTNDDRISNSVSTLLGIEIYYGKLDGENTGMKDEGVYARSHAEFTTSGWSREVRQLHKVKVEGQLEKVCFYSEKTWKASIQLNITISIPISIFLTKGYDNWIPWYQVEEYSYL
jgi:hypothetical protein